MSPNLPLFFVYAITGLGLSELFHKSSATVQMGRGCIQGFFGQGYSGLDRRRAIPLSMIILIRTRLWACNTRVTVAFIRTIGETPKTTTTEREEGRAEADGGRHLDLRSSAAPFLLVYSIGRVG